MTSPSHDHVFILTAEATTPLTHERASGLLVCGGFDPAEVFEDPQRETSFLAALYPASDFERLRQELGSLDFRSPAKTLSPDRPL